ncbi:MAG: gliding motility-associated C-terminal domain-containing protein [Vicingus serpentipes]|nr:gliding motility-associated C-terminal domain-containing protein [Vicingus serpentipes]
MKEGIDKIDEIFKQAFDGFEAHVDPAVWNNVQHSINNTASPSNTLPKSNPSLSTTFTKALILKIAGGVIAVSAVMTSAYFVVTNNEGKLEVKEQLTTQSDVGLEQNSPEIKKQELDVEVEEDFSIHQKNQISSEPVQEDIGNKEDVIVSNEEVKADRVNDKPLNETANPEKEQPKQSVKKPSKSQKESSPKETQDEVNATIIASVFSGKAPLDVQFEAEGNGVQYFWDFADGSDLSNEKSPYHTFAAPGLYKVSLTVIDKNANSKTVVNFIEVEKNVTSVLNKNEIPNVITPNNDGSNDELKITGENIKVFNARVMNSGGKVVYEWNSIEGKWDGTDMSGNKLIPGTYYLTIIAIGDDGERHTVNKAVQLFK